MVYAFSENTSDIYGHEEIMITVEQFKKIFPSCKNPIDTTKALNAILPKYEITTKERLTAFLAQTGHESGSFNTLKENLNYSAEGLCRVWPKRFSSLKEAQEYHRNPEKIANKVYADRMGNGPEHSGDGFLYCGRGAIQLTGKENYTKFASSIDMEIDEAVAYCETREGAIESACYFWTTHNLNGCADKGDFVALTKKINGGTTGLKERQELWYTAQKVL